MSRPKSDIALENVRIATPCHEKWDHMAGDERVRFCGKCFLNVYNLSAMSRAEAEQLVSSTEGRLCARYYQRADGTVLTSDCRWTELAAPDRARMLTALAIAAAGLIAVAGAAAAVPPGPGAPSSPEEFVTYLRCTHVSSGLQEDGLPADRVDAGDERASKRSRGKRSASAARHPQGTLDLLYPHRLDHDSLQWTTGIVGVAVRPTPPPSGRGRTGATILSEMQGLDSSQQLLASASDGLEIALESPYVEGGGREWLLLHDYLFGRQNALAAQLRATAPNYSSSQPGRFEFYFAVDEQGAIHGLKINRVGGAPESEALLQLFREEIARWQCPSPGRSANVVLILKIGAHRGPMKR